MEKVKYKCKGCGWTKEVPAEWADVKPRFCPTPTCELSVKKSKGRKSFRNNPEMLETTFKEVAQVVVIPEPETISIEEDNGKETRRRRT